MKATKRIVLSSCLLMLMAGWVHGQPAPSAPSDPTALLKELPADVSAFVAIPNLHKLDADVQGVLQQLQLAGMVPNPLDWLKNSTGLSKGLNENGPVGFAILNLKDAKSP